MWVLSFSDHGRYSGVAVHVGEAVAAPSMPFVVCAVFRGPRHFSGIWMYAGTPVRPRRRPTFPPSPPAFPPTLPTPPAFRRVRGTHRPTRLRPLRFSYQVAAASVPAGGALVSLRLQARGEQPCGPTRCPLGPPPSTTPRAPS